MKRLPYVVILLLIACHASVEKKYTPSAPVAQKIPNQYSEEGNSRVDNYSWINDRSDPKVINLLEAENKYVDSVMSHTEGLQKKLYDELVSRIEQKYESLPAKDNGYWYYRRFEESKQYPVYCRKKQNMDSPEEVMIDANELAKGHQIYLIRGRSVSRDNNWIAFGEDTSGNRNSTVHFLNLNTKAYSPEKIPNSSGDYAWSNDNKTFYYIQNDQTVRAYKVMKHILNTDPKNDKEIFTESDSTYDVYLSPSRDNRYIFVVSSSTTTTEARYIDGNNPAAEPVLIQPRVRDLLYYPDYTEGNVFYFLNNNNAKDFKVSASAIATPGLSNWKDVIPHQDSALLENYDILKDYIVVQHKVKGLNQLTVTNRNDNSSYKIDFGEDSYVADMSVATDAYDLDSIRYSYSSLTTPQSDFAYELGSKKKTLLKQQKVGGGYDASKYETKRVWAKVTDGTLVPISIVYRKSEFKKDGTNPMLLYAYGSYGASMDPDFGSSQISLLDRGFVYGIAHIRGGQEMGRYWYEDGKLLKKKNTFTDFVDCAQYLVNEKYTSPQKLFANGGSAGGMLMGAIINLRPDLFKGVIAEVPWMDVITDMFNPDLPLTTLEYDEWGDPHKKEYYEYMLSWSPYDNVKKVAYPAILATGGLNDSQVPYFSPAKWVQKVRENNVGNNPVLFKCNMGAGHGGESGRFERQKLTALKYAFMLDLLGIKN